MVLQSSSILFYPSTYLSAFAKVNWIVVRPIFNAIAACLASVPASAPWEACNVWRDWTQPAALHNCPASGSSPGRPNSLTSGSLCRSTHLAYSGGRVSTRPLAGPVSTEPAIEGFYENEVPLGSSYPFLNPMHRIWNPTRHDLGRAVIYTVQIKMYRHIWFHRLARKAGSGP